MGWGESSGEGNYGVNTEKWAKKGDQGKQREPFACFMLKGQNSSLRIVTVSANNKKSSTTPIITGND